MRHDILLTVLNMSFTASVVIAFVIVARLALKKAPKIYSYALWSVVLFRLLCPISFDSPASLMPVNEAPIPLDIGFEIYPEVHTGIDVVDREINRHLPDGRVESSVNPLQIWMFIAQIIWIFGMAIMVLLSVIRVIKLKAKLRTSVWLEEDIYLADNINSPFVFGLFKPRVYIPSNLAEDERKYIIAHEHCHIKRFDHLTRIIAFFALIVHWFNPLVWISFLLSAKDMEMSCDEQVMKSMEGDIRTRYSQSLLKFASGKSPIAATPLAFGEGDAKTRIKNVLRYKKPLVWVGKVSLVAVCLLNLSLMSNATENYSLLLEHKQVYMPTLEVQNDGLYSVAQESATPVTAKIFVGESEMNISQDRIVSALFALQITEEAVGMSRSEDRDDTHKIRLTFGSDANHYLDINIDRDFTELWINNYAKSDLDYALHPDSVEMLKELFS